MSTPVPRENQQLRTDRLPLLRRGMGGFYIQVFSEEPQATKKLKSIQLFGKDPKFGGSKNKKRLDEPLESIAQQAPLSGKYQIRHLYSHRQKEVAQVITIPAYIGGQGGFSRNHLGFITPH